MRAAKHAPRGRCHVLERHHGLAKIVERGGGVQHPCRVAAAHAIRLPEPPAERRSFRGAVSGRRDGVREREKRRAPTHARRIRSAQERPRGQEVAPLAEGTAHRKTTRNLKLRINQPPETSPERLRLLIASRSDARLSALENVPPNRSSGASRRRPAVCPGLFSFGERTNTNTARSKQEKRVARIKSLAGISDFASGLCVFLRLLSRLRRSKSTSANQRAASRTIRHPAKPSESAGHGSYSHTLPALRTPHNNKNGRHRRLQLRRRRPRQGGRAQDLLPPRRASRYVQVETIASVKPTISSARRERDEGERRRPKREALSMSRASRATPGRGLTAVSPTPDRQQSSAPCR